MSEMPHSESAVRRASWSIAILRAVAIAVIYYSPVIRLPVADTVWSMLWYIVLWQTWQPDRDRPVVVKGKCPI